MSADIRRKSVLLVDTDRDLLLGLGIRLRTAGYGVHIAMDALSAVGMAREAAPDLIVFRLALLGHDAAATLWRLRASPLAAVPLVLLTDRSLSAREKGLTAEATAVFQKPVDLDEVLSTISEALRESGNAITG